MKQVPMIFNTEMVKALLDGRKTVTRRPVSEAVSEFVQFVGSSDEECENLEFLGLMYDEWKDDNGKVRDPEYLVYCTEYAEEGVIPVGQGLARVGDLIWVRETMDINSYLDMYYLADDEPVWSEPEDWFYRSPEYVGKVPSIHMPKWASRLTLKITDVRIERVKDITEEQAIKEGVTPYQNTNKPLENPHRYSFLRLWCDLYGTDNPNAYVWVIEFEVIHKNILDIVGAAA